MIDTTLTSSLIPEGYATRPIIVAGCGTTGSWTAYTLLMCGFQNVTVIDFDQVLPHNTAAFLGGHPGRNKAEALRDNMSSLGLPTPLAINGRIEDHLCSVMLAVRSAGDGLLCVFSCVDTVESRRFICDRLDTGLDHSPMLIDYRMGLLSGSVLFASHFGPMSFPQFHDSLDVDFVPDGCGARAFLPTALSIVGLGISHWLHAMRGCCRLRARINIQVGTGLVTESSRPVPAERGYLQDSSAHSYAAPASAGREETP